MSKFPGRRRHQAGFSLLEILVAFAVLALVLGVVLRIFSGGLNMANRAEHYGRALLLAESKLATVAVEGPLEEGHSSGIFATDEGYRWQVSVIPYDWVRSETVADLPVHPLKVTVEVSWGEASQARSVSLTMLRLLPRQ